MGARGIFISIGVILVGMVTGVPILAALFATNGPYEQLRDLPVVGNECVYGPGSSMYAPDQVSFGLAAGITEFEAMPSDESVRIEGTVVPSETAYGADQITLLDADGAVIATLLPGFAYHVPNAEATPTMIGLGSTDALAKFNCDPADRFSLISQDTANIERHCLYGPGSGYGGTVGGVFIDSGFFRVLANDEKFELTADHSLRIVAFDTGQFTFDGDPVDEGQAWALDPGSGQPIILIGFATPAGGFPANCNIGSGTDVDAAAINPDVPSGNVALAYIDEGVIGNVAVRHGGTGLSDSPYRGILVALIALIPLFATAYFAFRFIYARN